MSIDPSQRPWFRATRTHGRFTAVPVVWQGWASLFGFIAAVVLIGMALLSMLMEIMGAFAVIIYLPLIGLAGWVFYRFVESKSEIDDLRQ